MTAKFKGCLYGDGKSSLWRGLAYSSSHSAVSPRASCVFSFRTPIIVSLPLYRSLPPHSWLQRLPRSASPRVHKAPGILSSFHANVVQPCPSSYAANMKKESNCQRNVMPLTRRMGIYGTYVSQSTRQKNPREIVSKFKSTPLKRGQRMDALTSLFQKAIDFSRIPYIDNTISIYPHSNQTLQPDTPRQDFLLPPRLGDFDSL